MQLYWKRLIKHYNLLSVRERVLIAVVLFGLIYAIWYFLLVFPISADWNNGKEELKQLHTEVEQLNSTITSFEDKIKTQENSPLAKEYKELKATEVSYQKQDNGILTYQVSPMEFLNAMNRLTAQLPGINLESIKASPPEPLIEKLPDGLSRFHVEVIFSANYFDTINYIHQIMTLKIPLFWESIDYHVKKYPLATVTIKIFVLGERKGLLHV